MSQQIKKEKTHSLRVVMLLVQYILQLGSDLLNSWVVTLLQILSHCQPGLFFSKLILPVNNKNHRKNLMESNQVLKPASK